MLDRYQCFGNTLCIVIDTKKNTTSYKHPAAAGGKWIRQDKRLAIYLRDHLACVYCGHGLEDNDTGRLTLDHVRPCSHGGSNAARNLVTACRRCNSQRGAQSVRKFAGLPGVTRVRRQTRRVLPLNQARAIIAAR